MSEILTEDKKTKRYYWLNDESRTFLSRGYLEESAEQRISDIAHTAEKILKIEGFANKFEEYMSRGFYSLSTPVWVNFGKDRGLPISCYGSNIDDSMDSILNAGREIGLMSKYGGGTSAYLGNIRPRGSKISTGGAADGPVHYARLYDTVIDVSKQSEARRGACAVWLPIEHDDISDFLDIGSEGNPIQNLQFGVTITDKWLEEMKSGDTNKRKIWAKVIQRRSEFGFPYIMFKDNTNNNSPYKDLGLEITASNLCLTADQRVVTSKGYLTVQELYESGEDLTLFDGEKAVSSTPMILRDSDSEILKITFDNGMSQKVTPNHGMALMNDDRGKIERVEAKDLKIGDYIAIQTNKGLFGDLDMVSNVESLPDKLETLPEWIWKSNEKTIWSFLNKLLKSDGDIEYFEDQIQLVHSSMNKNLTEDIQKLLTNLGLNCSIVPTNYNYYKLIFGSKNDALLIEEKTSFLSRKGIKLEEREYRDNTKKRTKVVSIETLENEPVYCPTVHSDEHIFVSNGVKTFNCSEIQLPTDSFHSFVCCLGSINLLHWDEIEKTDAIETYTLFLNAVMDEFVFKSYNMPGMKRAWRFASEHRAIGLGVLGYHSMLQSKRIPFESIKAKQYNERIFKILKERSEETSKNLYETNPEKYKCIRPGFANSTLIAIAPTKSSSFILGQVSMGIEPIKSNYFIKDLAKIKTIYKNPYLTEELEKYGMNTNEIWDNILKKDGSVQHLDFPTKEVFKTFLEISPKEIVLQAAQRQKYIDQSQSLNLMIHPSISAKDINQLYLYAHEEGIKTLYYQFSQNSAQVFSRNILECVNCEA